MLELINDLIKSVKNKETDFYSKILNGYLSLSRYEYGLLLSTDSSGIPYLASSSGISERDAGKQIEYYSVNYERLFSSFTDNENSDLPFSFRKDGSVFLMVFRCSLKGILVLGNKSGSDGLIESAWIVPFSGIVTGLLDLFNENRNSDDLLKVYKEESIRRNRYLTGLTNELRTPMNAIAGFAQLLKEPDMKMENISKYVSIISDTSEGVISKINSYSDIAEIENGTIKVLNTVFRLNELLDEVYLRHNRMFLAKGLSLEYKVEQEAAGAIIGDETKIRQILDILLSNAFQNTFSGKIFISCRIKGEFVEFCVNDTGSGINNEVRNSIFNYNTGQTSMAVNSKGSGLGLIIARSYAGLMGGKIWFESEEGKGSGFFFTIPYLPVSGNIKETKTGNVNDMKMIDTVKKKILVAEDDNLNFQLISNFLSKLNLEVIRAENGKEAVDIFKNDSIDLILMDIRMPVMDGYTAAKLIREISTDVKIIAQTAYSNDKSVAVSNGCNDFIAKPFSRNQLISMVTSYL